MFQYFDNGQWCTWEDTLDCPGWGGVAVGWGGLEWLREVRSGDGAEGEGVDEADTTKSANIFAEVTKSELTCDKG